MNIATVLKSEISRVSRRESKSHTQALKKASTQYRTDIAALKLRVAELERLVARLGKGLSKKTQPAVTNDEPVKVRFSAKGFASLRRKLGLSSAEMGLLIGVSDQSVYKYEKAEVQPRSATLANIAALRKLGKREVSERLAKAG
jgi:DNA-binding XRE family transcriptional regulator/ribosomal protein S18